jgi:hypothetical protein
MKTLKLIGFTLYILSSLLGIGLIIDFVVAVFRWDFSPWWFFPAGFCLVLVLMGAGGKLLETGEH